MLFTLLIVTLALPLAISLAVANAIREPAAGMFARVLDDTDGTAWTRVLQIVLVLSGTAGGAPVSGLDEITKLASSQATPIMRDRLMTLLFECAVGSVDALASALIPILFVAIITYGLRRRREDRAGDPAQSAALGPRREPDLAGALAADGA